MEYREEDFLMISGIQHFEFCRRQWALIHMEQMWEENLRTVEGEIMHKNAHNGSFIERRKDVITTRGMRVFSSRLGISGICDVVEFISDKNGCEIYQREGKYRVVPVEYKRGTPKEGMEDVMQVVLQAICLEEMLCCQVDKGYLYYGEPKRRTEVQITEELRIRAEKDVKEMHDLLEKMHTPKVKRTKKCNACSLKDICVPQLMKNTNVNEYIERMIGSGN